MGSHSKTKPRQNGAARASPGNGPKIGSDAQVQIGGLLQRMYADLLQEPVPAKFADILKRLPDGGPEDKA